MGENPRLTLSKNERLCNIKLIESLYKSPNVVKSYPLIFSYRISEVQLAHDFQILFTAPKRNFKKAVDRNRVKRILRDRFRLIKPEFLKPFEGKYIYCSIVYTAKELPLYQDIDKSLKKLIKKLHEEVIR